RALVAYLHTEWVDDVLDIIGPEDFCTTRVFEFADDSEHLVDVDRIIDSELLPMLLNRRTWIVSSAKAK
ncbi:MAG: hypothetical protein WAU07_05585, partial [Microgenomates group bacterium]